MAFTFELLVNLVLLATRPFSQFKLACLFGIRTALLFFYAWMELVKTIISFNVNVAWGIISWTLRLFTLPVRILDAYQREGQLDQKLQQMQDELENLVWDHKLLHERFQVAVKERKMLELLVAELEEEHDMAVAKIEKLEGKLQDQINENCRLKEIQGKGYWSSRDQNRTDICQDIDDSNYGTPRSLLQWNNTYKGRGISLQDVMMRKDDSKTRTELLNLLKTGLKPTSTISRNAGGGGALNHPRDIAISQSLFSAILSLVVGATVWEAKDPCMPLVVALFTVVVMSLKSVVHFFSTIENRPASDAVALLSFNWFILGTLTYPTLPRIAHMLAPLVLRLIDGAMSRFDFLSLA